MTLRKWLLEYFRTVVLAVFVLIHLTDLLAIHHSEDRERFTRIDNNTLEDRHLSLRARGLLAYLLSKPPGWNVVLNHLVRISPDGKKAVRAAVDELEKHGYLVRNGQQIVERGRFGHLDIDVYERPISDKTPDGTESPKEPRSRPGTMTKPLMGPSPQTPSTVEGPLVTTHQATTELLNQATTGKSAAAPPQSGGLPSDQNPQSSPTTVSGSSAVTDTRVRYVRQNGNLIPEPQRDTSIVYEPAGES
jgi:hypothetical protein